MSFELFKVAFGLRLSSLCLSIVQNLKSSIRKASGAHSRLLAERCLMGLELFEVGDRLLFSPRRMPVSIIDDKVVILRAVLGKTEVLPQKAEQFGAWPIVCQLFRGNTLTS